MTKIKFGPAGIGGVKQSISNLEKYKSLGFEACEVAFTRGVYIKNSEDAKKIGKAAKKLGITLSIHAHYWINLNSEDYSKVVNSKKRILECLETGTYLGATKVVFHPGYYGKRSKSETYENIKNEILDLQKIRKQKSYTPELAPETMGRKNVFGGVNEIAQLVSDTKCSFCIDFAHILARYGSYKFKEVFSKFKAKEYHIHFSGIEYGEKGERRHKKTSKDGWKRLINALPKNKQIIVINESPYSVDDSIFGLEIYNT